MGTLKSVCSSWFALISRDKYEHTLLRVPILFWWNQIGGFKKVCTFIVAFGQNKKKTKQRENQGSVYSDSLEKTKYVLKQRGRSEFNGFLSGYILFLDLNLTETRGS